MDRGVSIFLDTNIIQTFRGSKNKREFPKSNVSLDKLGISSDYYDIVKFIESNNLVGQIEICIPEIVVMEMKHHMTEGYKKQLKRMRSHIKEHTDLFGNLVVLREEGLKYTDEDYVNHVDSLFEDFFNTPRNYAKWIPFPRQSSILDTLVNKAISGIRPFVAAEINSKPYTDAGFKDALIAETIYEYRKKHNRRCIFITQDNDFGPEFEKTIHPKHKLSLFHSIEDTIKALTEYYDSNYGPLIWVRKEFENNTYLHELLLSENGVQYDESVTKCVVEDVSGFMGKFDLSGDEYEVKMYFIVNETKYDFDIHYDRFAHAILGCSCQIIND